MEVLALDQRGLAPALAPGVDHPPVGHEDLPGELAVAASDPERGAGRRHQIVDPQVEVGPGRVEQLAVEQRREQDRLDDPVAGGLPGLDHVVVEGREVAPEQRARQVGRLAPLRAMQPAEVVVEADVGRPDVLEHVGLDHQLERAPGRAASEQLVELLDQPRAAAAGDVRGAGQQRLPGVGLDREVEPGGELDRPDHPDRVLAEPDLGVADRADDAAVEVGHAVDEVDDPTGVEIVEQPVDGEVAPARVLLDRAPLVVVGDQEVVALLGLVALARVGPEGARLDDLRAEEHVGELEPAADDPAVAEHPADLLRTSARRDVEVLGFAVEIQVADAAADQVGFVVGREQLANDLERVGVDVPEGQGLALALRRSFAGGGPSVVRGHGFAVV